MAQSAAQRAAFLKMIGSRKSSAPSQSTPPSNPKTDAMQRRLNSKDSSTNTSSAPATGKDTKESPADQQKIAAAQQIIKEQQKIIYDLQHNGK